jgi:hypothetical protein
VVHGDRAAVHGDKFLNVNTMHNAGRERGGGGKENYRYNFLIHWLIICPFVWTNQNKKNEMTN